MSDDLTVPRIARSLDDLAVGMTVAAECMAGFPNAHWGVGTLAFNNNALGFRDHDGGWLFPFYNGAPGHVVILADPELDPAEQAWEAWRDHAEDDAPTVELTRESFLAGFRAGQEADHE